MDITSSESGKKAVRSWGMNTPFAVVSAYSDFNVARQMIGLGGVIEYIMKPLMREDVKRVLEKVEVLKTSAPSKIPANLQSQYPDAHPLTLKTLSIIENSYQTKLLQNEVARSLGITPEYFSYIFVKDIGVGFNKFLRQHRIEVAKALLLNGSQKKEDVAYAVGFSDTKYFCKVFHDETGMSVTEFMREHHK